MKETEDLIKKLSEEKISDITLSSKECFCPKSTFIKWALVMILFIILCILITLTNQPELTHRLDDHFIWLELTLAALTGVLAAMAACWLSTPDIKQQKWVIWLPFIPLVCLSFLIAYEFIISPTHKEHTESSMHCVTSIGLLAILPAAALFFMLKKHRTTHNRFFTITSVIAVASFAYLASRLICPQDDIAHLLFWHFIPTLVFASISAVIIYRLTRW